MGPWRDYRVDGEWIEIFLLCFRRNTQEVGPAEQRGERNVRSRTAHVSALPPWDLGFFISVWSRRDKMAIEGVFCETENEIFILLNWAPLETSGSCFKSIRNDIRAIWSLDKYERSVFETKVRTVHLFNLDYQREGGWPQILFPICGKLLFNAVWSKVSQKKGNGISNLPWLLLHRCICIIYLKKQELCQNLWRSNKISKDSAGFVIL